MGGVSRSVIVALVVAVDALAPAPAPPAPQAPARSVLPLLTAPRVRLLVDEAVRGRDQRAAWLRALATVHPRVRTAVLLTCVAVAVALWLAPGARTESCSTIFELSGAAVLQRCRASAGLAALAALMVAWAAALVLDARRGAHEEAKDGALTEELLAAAAAAAAYESTPEQRLRELSTRGVDSGNWRVDADLSNDEVGVFVNAHEQAVIVAYRGSATARDWASNFRSILPGDEHNSLSFRRGLAVARAARDKYLLYQSILLTGHSRGGAMADWAGRKLGLPSATFNPATWGKVVRGREEPATRSETVKTTSDLISVLETFLPGDRRVRLRLPKNWRQLLVLPALSALCLTAAWLLLLLAQRAAHTPPELAAGAADTLATAWGVETLRLAAWLRRLGTLCAALALFLGVLSSHPVTHFTAR
jgi:hypothetical protein